MISQVNDVKDQQAEAALLAQMQLRSVIYAMLSRLLRDYPDKACLDWLSQFPVDPKCDSAEMSAAWGQLKQAAAAYNESQLAEEYQQLFIGIGRGEVLPFGSWYQAGALMEMPLLHLRQDLRALGFERQGETKEPEDHIAALLEVMVMLIDAKNPAQNRFFMRHLSPWFARLCQDIAQADSSKFYRCVATLMQQFLAQEQHQFTLTAE